MGKVIHYDFNREMRRKEMEEIQQRTTERLIRFMQDPSFYSDELVQGEIHKDNFRYLQLENEEEKWGGRLSWEE